MYYFIYLYFAHIIIHVPLFVFVPHSTSALNNTSQVNTQHADKPYARGPMPYTPTQQNTKHPATTDSPKIQKY